MCALVSRRATLTYFGRSSAMSPAIVTLDRRQAAARRVEQLKLPELLEDDRRRDRPRRT